jgi:hypothetical protein
MNIGIIGGCMTCQSDLKLSQLFFRSFARKILENDCIKCFVSLRYYNEYFRIPELAENLINTSSPDIIILQIRPAPFIMRSELIIQNYRGKFILNPLFFSKYALEKIEKILGTENPDIIKVSDLKVGMRKYLLLFISRNNLAWGKFFFLRRNAITSLENYLNELIRMCNDKQIKLFVLGTINSYFNNHNDILSEMNAAMKKTAELSGVCYTDIFSQINDDKDSFFGTDRYHLNQNGHELAAGLLYECYKEHRISAE